MKYKNIMICSNVAGAGKDTAAEYLVKKGYIQLSFAKPIYEIAYNLFGMENKDRYLLQKIGEKMREIDYDVWAKTAYETADKWNKIFHAPVVLSDLRRDNEYEFGMKANFVPVRIVTDREIAIKRIEKRDGYCDISLLDNDSEIGTRHIVMPEITNDGTFVELYNKIDDFLKEI